MVVTVVVRRLPDPEPATPPLIRRLDPSDAGCGDPARPFTASQEERTMLIEAGFDIAFECPARRRCCFSSVSIRRGTPTSSRPTGSSPSRGCRCATTSTMFGNRVTRVEVPAGLVTFSNRFVIHDCGLPDATPPDVGTTPIADLPDDALLFLLSSRYCDSDKLADFAWSQFGRNAGGSRCMQAISDFVHAKIRFDYKQARSTRCASDSMHRRRRRVPRLRPSRHRAVPLHEHSRPLLHRLSRRHRRAARPQPRDFSGWAEVFLDGRWWTLDARHNHPRIGRIVMGRGRDAADVAMSTAFGVANLKRFVVVTDEKTEGR